MNRILALQFAFDWMIYDVHKVDYAVSADAKERIGKKMELSKKVVEFFSRLSK
jgi:hypothetical protein